MAKQNPKTKAESTPSAETEADVSKAAEQALASAQASVQELKTAATDVDQADPPNFDEDELDASSAVPSGLDMLGDVDLDVTIELGRTEMVVEDVLRLGRGSVVELDKLAGDPVDVYVNNRLIARGEVLVLNDNFCIRVNEIVEDLESQAQEAAQAEAEPAHTAAESA